MRRSIRWRLQFWYGVVLAGVVAGFAGLLYVEVRAARRREFDADLVAAANYLDSSLRLWPRFELDGEEPPKMKGGPKPPPRSRLLTDLTPPGWADASDHAYGVWRDDGSGIKVVGLPEERPEFPEGTGRDPKIYSLRELREAVRRGPRGIWILVRRSTVRMDADLRAFAWRLGIVGAAVLLVGLAGGWWVSSRITRPLAAITETASRISGHHLSARIDATTIDAELAELASVLNAAFDRVEAAFAQLARFTADASHELRTPLAVLRSQAELALSRPRQVEEYRVTLEACLKAATRLTHVVDGLLTLARADAGRLELSSTPIELDAVVRDAVAQARPLAEEKQVSITVKTQRAALDGDAVMLARVLGNLLDNAIRYSARGGEVRVEMTRDGDAVLTVADDGGGIPADDQPRIFQRFYRVEKARSRASGGTGLGLAICKAIVEGHRGTISFESWPGVGTRFTVRLPKARGLDSGPTPELPRP